jgi:hypothetical protein
MYLFARTRSVNPGSFRAGLAAAVEGGAKASEIIGSPVFVWTSIFSPTTGSVMWSMRVDNLEELLTAGDALAADDGFDEWSKDSDALFSGPFSDVVSQVIYGEPTGPPAPFISVVSATCANGSLSEGMGIGVEIAEMATSLTSSPTMFIAPLFGEYGAVGWISGAADLATLEADNAILSTDSEWLKLVDRAGHAFAPGVTGTLMRRLA